MICKVEASGCSWASGFSMPDLREITLFGFLGAFDFLSSDPELVDVSSSASTLLSAESNNASIDRIACKLLCRLFLLRSSFAWYLQ